RGVGLVDREGRGEGVCGPGEPMTMRFRLDSKLQRDDIVLAFTVHQADGHPICGINTLTHGQVLKVDEGPCYVDYQIASLPFWKNSYRITCIVHDLASDETFDCRQEEFGFSVMQGELGIGGGIVYLPGAWDLDGLRG